MFPLRELGLVVNSRRSDQAAVSYSWTTLSQSSGESTPQPWSPGTWNPGTWNPGALEPWNLEPWNLEPWNPGTLEPWSPGTLEPWNPGTLEPGTLGPWNPSNGTEWSQAANISNPPVRHKGECYRIYSKEYSSNHHEACCGGRPCRCCAL